MLLTPVYAFGLLRPAQTHIRTDGNVFPQKQTEWPKQNGCLDELEKPFFAYHNTISMLGLWENVNRSYQ